MKFTMQVERFNDSSSALLVVYRKKGREWAELTHEGEPLHLHLTTVLKAWERAVEKA